MNLSKALDKEIFRVAYPHLPDKVKQKLMNEVLSEVIDDAIDSFIPYWNAIR